MKSEPSVGKPNELRDLSDFCLEWPNLRDHMSRQKAPTDNWCEDSKATLDWLMKLAERTCVLD